nr:Uncharacterised protein [Raoultella sp. NCTC 9187]
MQGEKYLFRNYLHYQHRAPAFHLRLNLQIDMMCIYMDTRRYKVYKKNTIINGRMIPIHR